MCLSKEGREAVDCKSRAKYCYYGFCGGHFVDGQLCVHHSREENRSGRSKSRAKYCYYVILWWSFC
jgi:hypothetical protein